MVRGTGGSRKWDSGAREYVSVHDTQRVLKGVIRGEKDSRDDISWDYRIHFRMWVLEDN